MKDWTSQQHGLSAAFRRLALVLALCTAFFFAPKATIQADAVTEDDTAVRVEVQDPSDPEEEAEEKIKEDEKIIGGDCPKTDRFIVDALQ